MFGAPPEEQATSGEKRYLILRGAGVDVLCEGGTLVTIFLHCLPPPGYAPFRGDVRPGQPLPADQAGMRRALGAPRVAEEEQPIYLDHDQSGWAVPRRQIGTVPPFDRYEGEGHVLHCGYVSGTDRRLRMLTLMPAGYRPSYPSDE
jgi:hypothetical protein